MDITRRANREAQEATLQYRSRQESLLDNELIEDKLTQLLTFIAELEGTPTGAAEMKHRVTLFGACKRSEGETSAEFYPRLRHWLDRSMPKTKVSMNPTRQNEGV